MHRVYVISDLHLGGELAKPPSKGRRGFRLCTRPDAIVAFVKAVTARLAEGPTELVINGDMVDFLAERGPGGWSAFTQDPAEAIAKFKQILGRDQPVFDALSDFMEKGGALRILLGNHDIELSLPDVRTVLYAALGLKPKHDFRFLYDGEAYVVGDVLIEHGNRYDRWNQVDNDGLRRVRSLQSRRQKVPRKFDFVWPAGSEMVATVINPIKDDYPFIDLLKPEEATAVPLLLALEPGARSRLGKVARLRYATRKHGMEDDTIPKFGGDIRAGGMHTTKGNGRRKPTELEALRATVDEVLGANADAFWKAISDECIGGGSRGGNLAGGSSFGRAAGLMRLFASRDTSAIARRMPALLMALRGLRLAETFDPGKETAGEYLRAARELARGHIRCVVFGHTHLKKKINLGGDRFYFNSGTWADVLEFPRDILEGPEDVALERLTTFAETMAGGDFNGLPLDDRSYVLIEMNERDRVARIELASFKDDRII